MFTVEKSHTVIRKSVYNSYNYKCKCQSCNYSFLQVRGNFLIITPAKRFTYKRLCSLRNTVKDSCTYKGKIGNKTISSNPCIAAILSRIKLKTVVVTAEEISATKDATPSWQDLNISFILGNEGINFILFIFLRNGLNRSVYL